MLPRISCCHCFLQVGWILQYIKIPAKAHSIRKALQESTSLALGQNFFLRWKLFLAVPIAAKKPLCPNSSDQKLFERLLEQISFCTRLVNELPATKVWNSSTPILPAKSYFAPSSRLSPGGTDPFGSKVCNGPLRKKNRTKISGTSRRLLPSLKLTARTLPLKNGPFHGRIPKRQLVTSIPTSFLCHPFLRCGAFVVKFQGPESQVVIFWGKSHRWYMECISILQCEATKSR